MKIALSLVTVATCGIVTSAAAQSPIADALRSTEQRMGRNLVAAAEEMPAGKYGFKPTKAQMSFADVTEHLAQGNDYFCSKIGGVDAPKRDEVKASAGKEKLVARLKETFDFCETSLAKVDDSNLGGKVPFFGGREVTRAAMMMLTAEDWADHYSQFAIYLRLNGLLPPTAKQKEE